MMEGHYQLESTADGRPVRLSSSAAAAAATEGSLKQRQQRGDTMLDSSFVWTSAAAGCYPHGSNPGHPSPMNGYGSRADDRKTGSNIDKQQQQLILQLQLLKQRGSQQQQQQSLHHQHQQQQTRFNTLPYGPAAQQVYSGSQQRNSSVNNGERRLQTGPEQPPEIQAPSHYRFNSYAYESGAPAAISKEPSDLWRQNFESKTAAPSYVHHPTSQPTASDLSQIMEMKEEDRTNWLNRQQQQQQQRLEVGSRAEERTRLYVDTSSLMSRQALNHSAVIANACRNAQMKLARQQQQQQHQPQRVEMGWNPVTESGTSRRQNKPDTEMPFCSVPSDWNRTYTDSSESNIRLRTGQIRHVQYEPQMHSPNDRGGGAGLRSVPYCGLSPVSATGQKCTGSQSLAVGNHRSDLANVPAFQKDQASDGVVCDQNAATAAKQYCNVGDERLNIVMAQQQQQQRQQQQQQQQQWIRSYHGISPFHQSQPLSLPRRRNDAELSNRPDAFGGKGADIIASTDYQHSPMVLAAEISDRICEVYDQSEIDGRWLPRRYDGKSAGEVNPDAFVDRRLNENAAVMRLYKHFYDTSGETVVGASDAGEVIDLTRRITGADDAQSRQLSVTQDGGQNRSAILQPTSNSWQTAASRVSDTTDPKATFNRTQQGIENNAETNSENSADLDRTLSLLSTGVHQQSNDPPTAAGNCSSAAAAPDAVRCSRGTSVSQKSVIADRKKAMLERFAANCTPDEVVLAGLSGHQYSPKILKTSADKDAPCSQNWGYENAATFNESSAFFAGKRTSNLDDMSSNLMAARDAIQYISSPEKFPRYGNLPLVATVNAKATSALCDSVVKNCFLPIETSFADFSENKSTGSTDQTNIQRATDTNREYREASTTSTEKERINNETDENCDDEAEQLVDGVIPADIVSAVAEVLPELAISEITELCSTDQTSDDVVSEFNCLQGNASGSDIGASDFERAGLDTAKATGDGDELIDETAPLLVSIKEMSTGNSGQFSVSSSTSCKSRTEDEDDLPMPTIEDMRLFKGNAGRENQYPASKDEESNCNPDLGRPMTTDRAEVASKETDELVCSSGCSTETCTAVGCSKSHPRNTAFKKRDGLEEPHSNDMMTCLARKKISNKLVLVEIGPPLNFSCSTCSFQCLTELASNRHSARCKSGNSQFSDDISTFSCQNCQTTSSSRIHHFRHMAHHHNANSQIDNHIRYYVCSHCEYDCNDVTKMENHVTSSHTDKIFRYEVVQEPGFDRSRLAECPVCSEMYIWKSDYLQHVSSDHQLPELAAYLSNMFDDDGRGKEAETASALQLKIPRNLFRNLLPDESASSADESDFGASKDDELHSNRRVCHQNETDIIERKDDQVYNLDESIAGGSSEIGNANLHPKRLTVRGRPRFGCPLCPFHCEKHVHFLRHAEIHKRHSAQREHFRCGYCQFVHSRLQCVRAHSSKYHADRPVKIVEIVEGVSVGIVTDDEGDVPPTTVPVSTASSTAAVRTCRTFSETPTDYDVGAKTPPTAGKLPSCSVEPAVCSSLSVSSAVVAERSHLAKGKSSSQSSDVMTPSEIPSKVNDGSGVSVPSSVDSQIFERILPRSGFYVEPVKCPLCQFSSRLRIDLIRHLKSVHRDMAAACLNLTKICSVVLRPAAVEIAAHSSPLTSSLSNASDIKIQPRSHTSSRPSSRSSSTDNADVISETSSHKSAKDVVDKSSSASIGSMPPPTSSPSSSAAPNRINVVYGGSRKALMADEYEEYCFKIPDEEMFQCRRCDFTYRFPSKVRRHFYYQHSTVPPYRCGHCLRFGAAERGKVVKHCRQKHRKLEAFVITENEQDVFGGVGENKKADGDDECDDVSEGGMADVITDRTESFPDTDRKRVFDPSLPAGQQEYDSGNSRRGKTNRATRARLGRRSVNLRRSSLSADGDNGDPAAVDLQTDYGSSTIESDVSSNDDDDDESVPSDEYTNVGFISSTDTEFEGNCHPSRHLQQQQQQSISRRRADRRESSPIPCETIFAIYRLSYRNSNRLSTDSCQLETASLPAASDRSQISSDFATVEKKFVNDEISAGTYQPAEMRFRCAYCPAGSRWGRRDIQSHVFRIHMRMKFYSCGHCDYGHNRERFRVREHCRRVHNGADYVDNSKWFDAVQSAKTLGDGSEIIALVLPESGTPLLTLADLCKHFGWECTEENDSNRSQLVADGGSESCHAENVEAAAATVASVQDNKAIALLSVTDSGRGSASESDLSQESCLSPSARDVIGENGGKTSEKECGVVTETSNLTMENECSLVNPASEEQDYPKHTQVNTDTDSHVGNAVFTDDIRIASMDTGVIDGSDTVVDDLVKVEQHSRTNDEIGLNMKASAALTNGELNTAGNAATAAAATGSEVNDNRFDTTDRQVAPVAYSSSVGCSIEFTTSTTTEIDSDGSLRDLSDKLIDEEANSTDRDCRGHESFGEQGQGHGPSGSLTEKIQNEPMESDTEVKVTNNDREGTANRTPQGDGNSPDVSNGEALELADHNGSRKLEDVTPSESYELPAHTIQQSDDAAAAAAAAARNNNTSCQAKELAATPTGYYDDKRTSENHAAPAQPNSSTSTKLANETGETYHQSRESNDSVDCKRAVTIPALSCPPPNSLECNERFKNNLQVDCQVDTDSPSQPSLDRISAAILADDVINDGCLPPVLTKPDSDAAFDNDLPPVLEAQVLANKKHSCYTSETPEKEKTATSDENYDRPLDDVGLSNRLADLQQETSTERHHQQQRNQNCLETTDFQLKETYVGPWKCRQCNFVNGDLEKVQQHIIIRHLQLNRYSCPYCCTFFWKPPAVFEHVAKLHPGSEQRAIATAHEKRQYLCQNIERVNRAAAAAGTRPAAETGNTVGDVAVSNGELSINASDVSSVSTDAVNRAVEENAQKQAVEREVVATSQASLLCNLCTFVTYSRTIMMSHRRSHLIYCCSYCPYTHTLIAKAEAHCATVHPNEPVKYTKKTASASSTTGYGESTGTSGGCSSSSKSILSSVSREDYERLMRPVAKSPQLNGSKLAKTADSDDEEPEVEQRQNDDDDDDEEDDEYSKKSDGGSDCTAASKLAKPSAVRTSSTDDGGKPLRKTSSGVTGHYQCRQCHYMTYRPTMMRQHAMSHFRYYPYVCPYCNVKRAVRNVEIHKHVRLRHPERSDIRADYHRNEELEAKVKSSFYRVKKFANRQMVQQEMSSENRRADNQNLEEPSVSAARTRTDQTAGSSQSSGGEKTKTVAGTAAAAAAGEKKISSSDASLDTTTVQGSKRVIYKCVNCGLKTQQRNDMRYHLMRELHYKPYTCAYCPYSEPCKWSMRKHFRNKHAGLSVQVDTNRDDALDKRVEDLVARCLIQLHPVYNGPVANSAKLRLARQDAEEAAARNGDIDNDDEVEGDRKSNDESRSDARNFMMGLKTYSCPYCPYTSVSPKLVYCHKVQHTTYRFKCDHCDFVGPFPSRVRRHWHRAHRPKGLPYGHTELNVGNGKSKSSDAGAAAVAKQSEDQPSPPMTPTLLEKSRDAAASGRQALHKCCYCDYQHTFPCRVRRHWVRVHVKEGLPFKATTIEINVPPKKKKTAIAAAKTTSGKSSVTSSPGGLVDTRDAFKAGADIESGDDVSQSASDIASTPSGPSRKAKWRCLYCDREYHFIFQLRRHSLSLHPGLGVKWVDIRTGEEREDGLHTAEKDSPVNSTPSAFGASPVSASSNTTTTKLAGDKEAKNAGFAGNLSKRKRHQKIANTGRQHKKKRKKMSMTRRFLTKDPWSAGYRSEDEEDEDSNAADSDPDEEDFQSEYEEGVAPLTSDDDSEADRKLS